MLAMWEIALQLAISNERTLQNDGPLPSLPRPDLYAQIVLWKPKIAGGPHADDPKSCTPLFELNSFLRQPHNDGRWFGIYCPHCNVILQTGLVRESPVVVATANAGGAQPPKEGP